MLLTFDGVSWPKEVPTRQSFTVGRGIADQAVKGQPILFMPNDLEETTEYARGRPTYLLRVWGVSPDGAKVEVAITGVKVFFDVRAPEGTSAEAFEGQVSVILRSAGLEPLQLEQRKAFPIKGYHEMPVDYIRVHTTDLQSRKKARDVVSAAGYETAADDPSSYYRKAARERNLPLASWATLSGYEYIPGPTPASPLCSHVFRVPVEGYRQLVDDADPAMAAVVADRRELSRDRTLVLGWDIETYAPGGELPDAALDEDLVFMICISVHWKDDPTPLCSVCLVDIDTEPDPEWITVVCGSPTNVLKGFIHCWRGFAPDLQAGFNDGGYDWPFIIGKLQRHRPPLLSWAVGMMTAAPRRSASESDAEKWNLVRGKRIKISAEETMTVTYLKVPGCIPIDVRVCYKKLYPKSDVAANGSLNFYLSLVGLASKEDMPIKQMWDHYRYKSRTGMRAVARYCVIDARRCTELLIRRGVINDAREVGALSHTSIFDAFYYADGMKVCAKLGGSAEKLGIAVRMVASRAVEEGKYPGAFVFPPEKGLVPDPGRTRQLDEAIELGDATLIEEAFAAMGGDRPVTGLDFSSLYPSLIMAYNISPERKLNSEAEAEAVAAKGHTIHKVEFMFNGRQVQSWLVRHDMKPEEHGLYPKVLLEIVGKRSLLKVTLGALSSTKELLDLVFARASRDRISSGDALSALRDESAAAAQRARAAIDSGNPKVSPGGTLAEELADLKRLERNALEQCAEADRLATLNLEEECERVTFAIACVTAKSNALKRLGNTFYGELGNTLSPYYDLALAGAVTSAGQYNIKMVADFVRSRGFRIKYGDTDSLYLVAPREYFAECDEAYANKKLTKEEYWEAMVRVTMRALNGIREEVNALLARDNGTPYLKMAYEEVLFPVVFTGKKKYFGIPHLNEVNFHPKKLFIRGIDVIKQGQTGLAKQIGNKIMWESMSIKNRRTLRAIVEDVLRHAVIDGGWNFDDFVKSDAWRPDKENIPVQRFMARMRAARAIEDANNAALVARGEPPLPRSFELPEPGERFKYVIVKTGADFDLQGKKHDPKKGDRMAFAHVAKSQGLEIDVGFYIISYVVGLCARFINGDPEFLVPGETDEKILDKKAQTAAVKSLTELVRQASSGDTRTVSRQRGYAYRRAYRAALQQVEASVRAEVGEFAARFFDGRLVSYRDWDPTTATRTAWERAGWLAMAACPAGLRGIKLSRVIARVSEQLAAAMADAADVYSYYEACLESIVAHYRAAEHSAAPELGSCSEAPIARWPGFPPDLKERLKKLVWAWFRAAGTLLASGCAPEAMAYAR